MQISEAPTLSDELSRNVMKTMQENDTQRTEGKSAVYRRSQEEEQSRAEHAVYRRSQEEEQSRVLSCPRQPHLTKHQTNGNMPQ